MKKWKIGEKRRKLSKKRETRIKFYKRVQNKKIVINILYILFVLCVVFNVIYFVNTTIKEIDYFNLFGISLFSMETNLMEPEILENSLIITKKYGKNDSIEVNDKIAYSINEKVRINEVVSIETIDGKVIYHTKSNQNYNVDAEGIFQNQVIGKVEMVIPNLGIGLEILQSKIMTLGIVVHIIMRLLVVHNFCLLLLLLSRPNRVSKASEFINCSCFSVISISMPSLLFYAYIYFKWFCLP